MSGAQIIGVSPGQTIAQGQVFRAIWYPNFLQTLSAWDTPTIGVNLYSLLRASSIDYVTPINAPAVPMGADRVTIDLQAFTPDNPLTTVADLANALNALLLSSSLQSLQLVSLGDAIGSNGNDSRDAATQVAAAQTPPDFMSQLGAEARYVLLVVLVIVALLVVLGARKLVREIS